jgi:hypothetical protein
MKKELKNNNVSLIDYVYLYDRVKKNKKEKQLYGTQMVYDSLGIHSPYPIEDEENVNKRRKEVGLKPIDSYIKSFNTK